MKILILEAANQEIIQAVEFYNLQFFGLGEKFKDELFYSFELIAKYPNAWKKTSKRIRMFTMQKFPFGIFYQVRRSEILITTVYHFKRKPKY